MVLPAQILHYHCPTLILPACHTTPKETTQPRVLLPQGSAVYAEALS